MMQDQCDVPPCPWCPPLSIQISLGHGCRMSFLWHNSDYVLSLPKTCSKLLWFIGWVYELIYSCIQGSSLPSNTCLLFLVVFHLTSKLHWTLLHSESALYMLIPIQHVMIFPFPGIICTIIQIITILWNPIKMSLSHSLIFVRDLTSHSLVSCSFCPYLCRSTHHVCLC